MTADGSPGSARWIRRVLTDHWGAPWDDAGLRPLSVGGAAPLSHTAGLWRVEVPQGTYVLKAQLNPEALRAPRFYPLKERVLAHCRARGVPVLPAVPAADGATSVWQDGLVCELAPHCPGTARALGSPAQRAALVGTGLDLRQALDDLAPDVVEALAPLPVPRLVDEENGPAALADAELRLLPKAERGTDRWHRAAATALRELLAAAPLMHRAHQEARQPAAPSVVHSDLHHHHFLLAPDGSPEVLAVLDFDNLQVGDRLLDLAWLAETAARVPEGPDTRRALDGFLAAARRRDLLRPGEERQLMPLLLAHSLPVIVDIAKDILDRDILSPLWLDYFALLSPARRLRVHHLLTDLAPL